MANVDTHAPGAFSWIELSTRNQNAAKEFYMSLMGWTFTDSPMGPTEVYTTFELKGRKAAAAYTMQKAEADQGIPSHWNLYITVASADETSAKVAGLGGKVLVGPFDVMTHGRMSVVMDPTGASFCIWEPKDHPGITIQGEPNALCWADLSTPDQAVAARFYEGLFGYKMSAGQGDSGYLHIENGADMIGGIQPCADNNPKRPPFWLIYLQVDDCDAMTDKAKGLGAKVYMGPETMENVGRMTILADPQGAVFALFQPAPRG